MNRGVRRLAALLLGAMLLLPVSPAQAATTAPRQVVIVLAPYLTWDDVTSGAMPVTERLAKTASLGDVNIRSSARFATEVTPMHVALTMSAGSPAAFDPFAPSAYDLDQIIEGGTAAEAYRRSMGRSAEDAAIGYLGLPRVIRENTLSTLETVPGALGQAIVDAGGSTAALGNSDGGYREGIVYRSRPAALLAMDASGLVTFGDVSTLMLTDKAGAPYGLTTDIPTLEATYRDVLRKTREHGGPALIVLDPGDAERAFNFSADASQQAAEAHRDEAMRTVDRVVRMAVEGLPDDAVLMVVSIAQARPASGPSGFGPLILSGRGYEQGLLSSPSTHRLGLVTDLDVAATVLDTLGIERPVEVLGNVAAPSGASTDVGARTRFLRGLNATAVAVDTVRPLVQNSYITVTVIVLLACAALLHPMQLAFRTWGGRVAHALGDLILLLLSIPLASTLMYLVVRRPDSAAVVGLAFGVTTLLVWGGARLLQLRLGPLVALGAVGLGSALVLLTDQLFGAPLSFSGMFSYSPLLGARYYGLGNEAASVMVGGGLTGLALLIDAFHDKPWIEQVRRFGPPVLGVLVIGIAAAPFFGANVGVIAWATVAFGIMWMQLNGRRVSWKTLVAMLGFIAVVVIAFSLYDTLAGAGAQTHLGRAIDSARTGGVSELWLIVARKAETNWRVLRATNWSILMIAILAFLGFMRWRPQGIFAETLAAYPAFAVAMTAALWGSVAGYFTEDSGIVIPALVMLYVTGSLLHIMLSRLAPETEASRT